MANCYVAMGGNVGDVFAMMEHALVTLDRAEGLRVIAVSPVYETAPVGPAEQPSYLNAAAHLECDLSPLDLLRELQSAENLAGRKRTSRWGERTLDLDLLLYDEIVLNEPKLIVPHPHLWYRRFVLDPLTEIAAEVRHPVLGETIESLRNRLVQRPLTVTIVGGSIVEREQVSEHIRHDDSSAVEVRDSSMESQSVPIALDLNSPTDARPSDVLLPRHVRLKSLPGSIVEAADFVLTAALDEPRRHNRPLRRIP